MSLTEIFMSIAEAIRSKNGKTTKYAPEDMSDAIKKIPTNTSPDVKIQEEVTVTKNGLVTPSAGYDAMLAVYVDVPIPDGYLIPSGEFKVGNNGTYPIAPYESVKVDVKPSLQQKKVSLNLNTTLTILADSKYDGLSKVEVTVAVPEFDGFVTISPSIITFTIDGVPYSVEAGTTWSESGLVVIGWANAENTSTHLWYDVKNGPIKEYVSSNALRDQGYNEQRGYMAIKHGEDYVTS